MRRGLAIHALLALLTLAALSACGEEERNESPLETRPAPTTDTQRPAPTPDTSGLPTLQGIEQRAREGELDDRLDAIWDLGARNGTNDQPAVQAVLRELLQDPSEKIRTAALERLDKASIALVEDTLFEWLEDLDGPHREDAYDLLFNTDEEAEARRQRALAIALREPERDLAHQALWDVTFAARDRSDELLSALLQFGRQSTETSQRLRAYSLLGRWCTPELARTAAKEIVAIVNEHEGELDADEQAALHAKAVSALDALGPEAESATGYLVRVMLTAPPQSGPPPDEKEIFGLFMFDLSDRPSEKAAVLLSKLGPLAGDAVATLYAWIDDRELPLGPVMQYAMPWGLKPPAVADIVRRRLWDESRREDALLCSAPLGKTMESELLRVWSWLSPEHKELAFFLMLRAGASRATLLPLAYEMLERTHMYVATPADVVVLSHHRHGQLRVRAERMIRRELASGETERASLVVNSLLMAPPRVASLFLEEARKRVFRDGDNDDLKPDWDQFAALLLRAGGDDRKRVLKFLRAQLQRTGTRPLNAIAAAQRAGADGRILVPDILAFVSTAPPPSASIATLHLGAIGERTPAVREALRELRKSPDPLSRLYAAASLHKLSNR